MPRPSAKCPTCQTLRETIGDLRAMLTASEADRRQLTDRLLALTHPQALSIARGEGRQRGPTPTFGYDPEVGHEIFTHGEERPVTMGPDGRPKVPLGGKLVDAEEVDRWMDILASEAAGQGPIQRLGLNGDEAPPSDPGDEVARG